MITPPEYLLVECDEMTVYRGSSLKEVIEVTIDNIRKYKDCESRTSALIRFIRRESTLH